MSTVDFSYGFEIDLSQSLSGKSFPMLMYSDEHTPGNDEEAWGITLRKWEILSGQDEDGPAIVHDGGVSTCGLCMLYHGYLTKDETICGECPIARTGHSECSGTPYREYRGAKTVEEARMFAKKELYFLKQIKKRSGGKK